MMISFNYLSIRRYGFVRLPFFISEISRPGEKKFFPGGLDRFSQGNRPCCAADISVLFCGGRRHAWILRFPGPAMPTACSYSLQKRNSRPQCGSRLRASDKSARDVFRWLLA